MRVAAPRGVGHTKTAPPPEGDGAVRLLDAFGYRMPGAVICGPACGRGLPRLVVAGHELPARVVLRRGDRGDGPPGRRRAHSEANRLTRVSQTAPDAPDRPDAT